GAGQDGGCLLNRGRLWLYDVTLHHCQAANGGAIYNLGTADLYNPNLYSNQAGGQGGGLASHPPSGGLWISGGRLDGNTAQGSGGGLAQLSGPAVISGTLITGNSAPYGGGLVSLAPLTVTLSQVSENSASWRGGGVLATGWLNLSASAVVSNTVAGAQPVIPGIPGQGGGLYLGGPAQLTNVTIAGNRVRNIVEPNSGGAAIFMTGGPVTLLHSTLTGNLAANRPAASGLVTTIGSSLRLHNSLVFANGPGGKENFIVQGSLASSGGNLTNSSGISQLDQADDRQGAVLLSGRLWQYQPGRWIIPLLPGDPAIDAANVAGCDLDAVNAQDGRGAARPQRSACDSGAFESGGFTLNILGGSGQVTPVNQAFALALRISVTPTLPGDPVDGGRVVFRPPTSSASAALNGQAAGAALTLDIAGSQAGTAAAANGLTGGYAVTVSSRGANDVDFNLVNGCTATPLVSNALDSGPGTLRRALDTVCPAGVITFAPGVTHIDLLSQLSVPLSVTISGGAGGVTLDGQAGTRIFDLQAGRPITVQLSGLNLVNGRAPAEGGGALRSGPGTALRLAQMQLTGSQALMGGALYSEGSLAVTDTQLRGNQADTGGALYILGSLVMTNTSVSSNQALNGGALYLATGASGRVRGGVFEDNAAGQNGGAIYSAAPLQLHTTTVISSTAGGAAARGAGIYSAGPLQLVNVTVSRSRLVSNTALGGGLYISADTAGLLHTSVVDNRSSGAGQGSGIYIAAGATLTLHNSLAAGSGLDGLDNFAIYGTLTSLGGSLTNSSPLSQLNQPGDRTGLPALTGALWEYQPGRWTVPLLPGSPAIDAALPGGCSLPELGAGDGRGQPRPVGAACDSGAYESGGFSFSATGGSGQSARLDQAFAQPLGVQVSANIPGEPVDGGRVGFSAPGSGPSASLSYTQTVLSGGLASVSATANTLAGSYSVQATCHPAAPLDFTLTNTLHTSSVALQSDRTALPMGETLYLTATISGGEMALDGLVTFQDGGSDIPGCVDLPPDSLGRALCPVVFNTVGPHSLTAAYNGGTRHHPAVSDPLNVTALSRAGLTLQLQTHHSEVLIGLTGLVTATVGNLGPELAEGVVLTASLPVQLTPAEGLPSGCSQAGALIHCAVGSLAAGEQVSYSLRLRLASNTPDGTLLEIPSGVSALTEDRNLDDNFALAQLTARWKILAYTLSLPAGPEWS
ncbi:MAG: choice-of-anchor Q domain-containing protein, partial [Chloroflexota bacterium]